MLRVNNEKYDVICENFDGYFEQRASRMTEQQKAALPKKLMVKLYRKGGKMTNNLNPHKLNFLEKLYVLFKGFKTRWFIVVQDENVIDDDDWDKWKELAKKGEITESNAQRLVNQGMFVLGCNEMVDGFSFLNDNSAAPVYKYLIKAKNSKGVAEYRQERDYITSFLTAYESNKKKFLINTGITLAEWYILVHIYTQGEVLCSTIYKDVFKYAFGGSKQSIKNSFGAIQSKGYAVKKGYTKGATIKITPMGRDLVNQILSKYIINF